MTDEELLTWARQEFDRQMATDATCSRCGRHAGEAGVTRWLCCDNCGEPICDRCAVQANDGRFCPTCPPELPF